MLPCQATETGTSAGEIATGAGLTTEQQLAAAAVAALTSGEGVLNLDTWCTVQFASLLTCAHVAADKTGDASLVF